VVKKVGLKVVECAGEQDNQVTALQIQNTGETEISTTFEVHNADTKTDTGLRVTVTDTGHGLLPGASNIFYTRDTAGASSPILSSGSYVLKADGFSDVAFTCSLEVPKAELLVTSCLVNENGTWLTAKNVGTNRIMATFSVYKSDGTPLQQTVNYAEMSPGMTLTSRIYSQPYGGAPKLATGTYVLKASGFTDTAFSC
jgi:hypothetical protein